MIIFMKKHFSTASKGFATFCFFTDHLNHKIMNKTTCRTTTANPSQLWTHLKSFRTVDYFSRFSGLPDLSGNIFLTTFKFS